MRPPLQIRPDTSILPRPGDAASKTRRRRALPSLVIPSAAEGSRRASCRRHASRRNAWSVAPGREARGNPDAPPSPVCRGAPNGATEAVAPLQDSRGRLGSTTCRASKRTGGQAAGTGAAARRGLHASRRWRRGLVSTDWQAIGGTRLVMMAPRGDGIGDPRSRLTTTTLPRHAAAYMPAGDGAEVW